MATWVPTTARAGIQPIATTSTTQLHPLGTVITAEDTATSGQGGGEFIYLLGVAATVVGHMVTYNTTTFQTTLTLPNPNQAAPIAVAMSANVAAQYGWYQIGGNAVIKKTAVKITANGKVLFAAATASPGRVKIVVSAGRQILGARSANLATVTTTTSTVMVTIDRPHFQGQIT